MCVIVLFIVWFNGLSYNKSVNTVSVLWHLFKTAFFLFVVISVRFESNTHVKSGNDLGKDEAM